MTYQGERARPASEIGRFFEMSKVRIGPDGHISDVRWGEVNASSDLDVGARVLATAAEVVDAIHDGAQVAAVFPTNDRLPERAFVIFEHEDGRECIVFDAAPSPGRMSPTWTASMRDTDLPAAPMARPPWGHQWRPGEAGSAVIAWALLIKTRRGCRLTP